jgi:DNA-binding transcriptional LysR family regulator
VHFNRFGRLGLVLLLLAPIVLAVTALAGLITLPHIAEHVADFLLGVELVVFSFLNARYELLRRWVKRLGWLGQPPFSLDTDSVASVFALVVGLGWTLGPLMLLIRDFSR